MTDTCWCGMELLPYIKRYTVLTDNNKYDKSSHVWKKEHVYIGKRNTVRRPQVFCDELCRSHFLWRVAQEERGITLRL